MTKRAGVETDANKRLRESLKALDLPAIHADIGFINAYANGVRGLVIRDSDGKELHRPSDPFEGSFNNIIREIMKPDLSELYSGIEREYTRTHQLVSETNIALAKMPKVSSRFAILQNELEKNRVAVAKLEITYLHLEKNCHDLYCGFMRRLALEYSTTSHALREALADDRRTVQEVYLLWTLHGVEKAASYFGIR